MAAINPDDPQWPPIHCVRVADTEQDGEMVPTWRAMGEDVRRLGNEWERQILAGEANRWGPYPWDSDTPHGVAFPELVYLVRRVAPPKPATELVPWWDAVGRTIPDGREVVAVGYRQDDPTPWFTVRDFARQESADDFTTADGMVEVLR